MPIRLKQFRRELIKQLTDFDAISGQFDASSLLCHCLNINQAQLLTDDFELSLQQQQHIKQLTQRYIQDEEPLDYLLGYTCFMGLNFKVNSNVLIPRSDTENLVSWLIDYLSNQATPRGRANTWKVLDLGMGSGVIAISLLKNLQNLSVTAIDKSYLALSVAKENANFLLSKEQQTYLQFLEGDWFNALKKQRQQQYYDVIIANPPYVDLETRRLSKSLSHEPDEALYSSKHGLANIEVIIQQAPSVLCKGGLLILEHGFNQSDAVAHLLETCQFRKIAKHCDLSQRQRFTTAFHYY